MLGFKVKLASDRKTCSANAPPYHQRPAHIYTQTRGEPPLTTFLPFPPPCKQNYLPQQHKHLSDRSGKSPYSLTVRVCTRTLSQVNTCLPWGCLGSRSWCNPIFCHRDPMRNDNSSPGPCTLTMGVWGGQGWRTTSFC